MPIDPFIIAKERDVKINFYDFSKIDGICTETPLGRYIGLSGSMNEIKTREVLAHELWHIQDGTSDSFHFSLSEKRADKIGREILLPVEELIEEIQDRGECDINYLSLIFWVSYTTLEKRIKEIYKL